MALSITDGTSHFVIQHTTTVADSYPKNSVGLRRSGDYFTLINGGDNFKPFLQRTIWSDFTAIGGVAPTDADDAETKLKAVIFQ